LGGFSWDYRFLHDGKVNSESSSLTRHTVYFDRASALFHNAVYGRQPEACAFANWLSSEERLEEMSLGFGIHATTGVSHLYHRIRGCMARCRRFRTRSGYLRRPYFQYSS